jgi:hypothetical protein
MDSSPDLLAKEDINADIIKFCSTRRPLDNQGTPVSQVEIEPVLTQLEALGPA